MNVKVDLKKENLQKQNDVVSRVLYLDGRVAEGYVKPMYL